LTSTKLDGAIIRRAASKGKEATKIKGAFYIEDDVKKWVTCRWLVDQGCEIKN
jgi:hypothetical protein